MSLTLQLAGEEEVLEALDLPVEAQIEAVIDRLLTESTDFAALRTPVVTGAMRAAWEWSRIGLEGRMTINPSAVNPKTGARVSNYAPAVEARLGILEGAYDRIATMEFEGVGWNGD